MTALVLTYIGTILIAFEFFIESRLTEGLKDVQALTALIIAWPYRSFLNAKSDGHLAEVIKNTNIIKIILFSIFLVPCLLLLILGLIIFRSLSFIFSLFEEAHKQFNRLYLHLMKEYKPTYNYWTRIVLKSFGKNKEITEEQVFSELQKGKIPIFPIIGVILITISLVMQLS